MLTTGAPPRQLKRSATVGANVSTKVISMIWLILPGVSTIVTFIVFGNSRQTHETRRWTNQSSSERLMISLALATASQFLFIMMIPDWIVAAMFVGKGSIAESRLRNEIFGIVKEHQRHAL